MRLTDSAYEVWLDLFNLHRAESPLFCIWCLWDGPFFSSFCCPVPVFQLKPTAPPRGQYFKSVTAMSYRERHGSYIWKWSLDIRGTVIRAFRTRWAQYLPRFLIALVSRTEPVCLASAPDFAEHWETTINGVNILHYSIHLTFRVLWVVTAASIIMCASKNITKRRRNFKIRQCEQQFSTSVIILYLGWEIPVLYAKLIQLV